MTKRVMNESFVGAIHRVQVGGVGELDPDHQQICECLSPTQRMDCTMRSVGVVWLPTSPKSAPRRYPDPGPLASDLDQVLGPDAVRKARQRLTRHGDG